MPFASRKPIDVNRLKADLASASIELLSAHCAVDRVRLQYTPQDIVSFGERASLKKSITSAEAVCRFFSLIEAHLNSMEETGG